MKHLILFFLLALSLSAAHSSENGIDQKAVLVTGASSGIGLSIAKTLANKGVFVYAGARKAKDIERLSAIKNVQGVRLDVTRQDEIDAAVQLISKAGRGLDGVVNNAGVFFHAPLIEVSEEKLEFMLDVNVFGPYRVSKAFAPLLIENKGRISTISSIAGISAGPMFGPYAMSKFAVEAFSESLHHEMKHLGVQVSVIEPGNFNSKIMKNMRKRNKGTEVEGQTTLFAKQYAALENFTATDRSRHRDPIAVADAVAHALFSEQPKFRYLVAPNQAEADLTLRAAISKVAQLNRDHEFTQSPETLVEMLEKALQ